MCRRPGSPYRRAVRAPQGLEFAAGVSAQSTGASGICLHRLIMPPGTRAKAHLHAGHESAIYLISGTVEFWSGPALERHDTVEAGEFVYIPAGVPHLPVNIGTVTAEAVVARTDPDEQEHVVPLPALDGLPHLPPRHTAG